MELFAQAYQQLASISAVLGGLAFTAAAALLAVGAGSNNPDALDRAAKITVATAVISAVLLVVAALMWSFMAADISRAIARGQLELAQRVAAKNMLPSFALLGGLFVFFASLGSSGWIASRRLGWLTTSAGAFGFIAMLFMIYWFADMG